MSEMIYNLHSPYNLLCSMFQIISCRTATSKQKQKNWRIDVIYNNEGWAN